MKNQKKQCFQHTSHQFSRNYWFLLVFSKVFLVFKPKNKKTLQFCWLFTGFPMKNKKTFSFLVFWLAFGKKQKTFSLFGVSLENLQKNTKLKVFFGF